jgi:hypothetical protein
LAQAPRARKSRRNPGPGHLESLLQGLVQQLLGVDARHLEVDGFREPAEVCPTPVVTH